MQYVHMEPRNIAEEVLEQMLDRRFSQFEGRFDTKMDEYMLMIK